MGLNLIKGIIIAVLIIVLVFYFIQVAGNMKIPFEFEKDISKATRCSLIRCKYGCENERIVDVDSWYYDGNEITCFDFCGGELEKICDDESKENPIYITIEDEKEFSARITPRNFKKEDRDCFARIYHDNSENMISPPHRCFCELHIDEEILCVDETNPLENVMGDLFDHCYFEEGKTYKIITMEYGIGRHTYVTKISEVEDELGE